MNKNVLAVFAAICGLAMVSCDTPSDQRPGVKVSVDYVAPGQRHTPNLSDVGAGQFNTHREDVMMNHDPGANTVEAGDSIPTEETSNEAENVINR